MRKGGGGQGKGCEKVAEGKAGFFYLRGACRALSPCSPIYEEQAGRFWALLPDALQTFINSWFLCVLVLNQYFPTIPSIVWYYIRNSLYFAFITLKPETTKTATRS
jgi:hypothetical protein